VCAKYSASGGAHGSSRFSKFAKFQVRPKSGWNARWLMEQHEKSQSHRIACGRSGDRFETNVDQAQPQPLACPPALGSDNPVSLQDTELLKGNVPSPAEWKDAWAFLSERCSLRKEARLFGKRSGVCGVENSRRKRHRRQLIVMAEALRKRIRKALSQATSISLALDEAKYRKIIRFRADLPSAQRSGSLWRHAGASGFCFSGVLGILDCSKKHASDFENDHAVTAVKQLDAFLTEFCTPLGRGDRGRPQLLACDEELRAHLLNTVTSIAAAGASKERRAAFLVARDLFPTSSS